MYKAYPYFFVPSPLTFDVKMADESHDLPGQPSQHAMHLNLDPQRRYANELDPEIIHDRSPLLSDIDIKDSSEGLRLTEA